jgi:hypothetical protein
VLHDSAIRSSDTGFRDFGRLGRAGESLHGAQNKREIKLKKVLDRISVSNGRYPQNNRASTQIGSM